MPLGLLGVLALLALLALMGFLGLLGFLVFLRLLGLMGFLGLLGFLGGSWGSSSSWRSCVSSGSCDGATTIIQKRLIAFVCESTVWGSTVWEFRGSRATDFGAGDALIGLGVYSLGV